MATWASIYTRIDKPPLSNPPPNWEQAVIPSGRHLPYYQTEAWSEEYDEDGKKIGHILWWYRTWYWIPAQTFRMQQLQKDNTWKDAGTFQGPSVYLALNSIDGKPTIMRLIAA